MNTAAAQLDSYDREQKTFFQNVSHELRTPLQSIRCSAEGIEHGILEQRQASRIIIAETDRLSDMVEDLLYLSRIDSISLSDERSECDLREIISNCAERQRGVAMERGLKYVFNFAPHPVHFYCVEKHLSRAFSNLISNAIRYAEKVITLTCHQDGKEIIVTVKDDGPGIPEKDLPFIFDRFYSGKGGKHGIGLAIVKTVIEQHYGTIKVKSDTIGSTFTVIFNTCKR
jgi:two-component system, OmpR family, sensor histidine kinase CssS